MGIRDGTKSAPRSARGKATRDRIIAVAETLIAKHGPDGFQLQNVTEELGITPPAIYNHFKDRDDLVRQIAEKGDRILNDRLRRRPGENVLESLRRNARDFVEFLVEYPAYARLILWDLARRGTSGWRGHSASNTDMRDRMSVAFEQAAKNGVIRSISIDVYLQFFYIGCAASVVWTKHDESPTVLPTRTPAEIERMKDRAEDLVLRLLSPTIGEIDD